MKTRSSVVLVVVGMLLFASGKHIAAAQPKDSHSKGTYANSLADGGCLRMKHSPILGMNVVVSVTIDGVYAGLFSKGHVFERYLTPGRHTLMASRSRQAFGSWNGTLDVRRGETYSFVVKVTSNEVFLQPTGPLN
jgi:hypothetical protein